MLCVMLSQQAIQASGLHLSVYRDLTANLATYFSTTARTVKQHKVALLNAGVPGYRLDAYLEDLDARLDVSEAPEGCCSLPADSLATAVPSAAHHRMSCDVTLRACCSCCSTGSPAARLQLGSLRCKEAKHRKVCRPVPCLVVLVAFNAMMIDVADRFDEERLLLHWVSLAAGQ